jgi:hypothetical protein
MNDELFNELMESVREGGAILRGEIAPGRRRELLHVQQKNVVFFSSARLACWRSRWWCG